LLPAAGLAVAASSLREPLVFLRWYLVLLALAYILGLIILALLGLSPAWMRALVAAILTYAVVLANPLTTTMASFPIHVISCGGRPIVATDFAAARSYPAPMRAHALVTPLDPRSSAPGRAARPPSLHPPLPPA